MDTVKIECDGLVLYTDGSFRRNQAGYGIHGYAYVKTPLTETLGEQVLPTQKGYQAVELSKSVTPVEIIDAYGSVTKDPTNNTAELSAAIEALKMAQNYTGSSLYMLLDSQYVIKGVSSTTKWAANNWTKPDGTAVANRSYWQEMVRVKKEYEELGKTVSFTWVKGHNGDKGNELADRNARLGSGGVPVKHASTNKPATSKVKKLDANPLMIKKAMLFSLDSETPSFDGFYYLYHLGRLHKYGHKQEDTAMDKIRKTDLILGRRNSEASFCVYKPKQPEEYLETLKAQHAKAHKQDVIEIGVIRLDIAYKPDVVNSISELGVGALVNLGALRALVTPQDEVVSITLNPPRLAFSAAATFSIMQRRLQSYLDGTLGEAMQCLDITDLFFAEETVGKRVVTKLHKTITTATQIIDKEIEFAGKKVKIRLALGIDLPNRNALAKIANLEPKVKLLVVADGPVSYSFSTVFETNDGDAIYQNPYMKFVLGA